MITSLKQASKSTAFEQWLGAVRGGGGGGGAPPAGAADAGAAGADGAAQGSPPSHQAELAATLAEVAEYLAQQGITAPADPASLAADNSRFKCAREGLRCSVVLGEWPGGQAARRSGGRRRGSICSWVFTFYVVVFNICYVVMFVSRRAGWEDISRMNQRHATLTHSPLLSLPPPSLCRPGWEDIFQMNQKHATLTHPPLLSLLPPPCAGQAGRTSST